MCVHGGQRSTSDVTSQDTILFRFFGRERLQLSHWDLGLNNLAMLTSQPAPRIHLSPHTQSQHHTRIFSHSFWGWNSDPCTYKACTLLSHLSSPPHQVIYEAPTMCWILEYFHYSQMKCKIFFPSSETLYWSLMSPFHLRV